MTDIDLKVENAVLRGTLWLSANALKEYHESPYSAYDDNGIPKVQVIVSEVTRSKAAEALDRANKVLKG